MSTLLADLERLLVEETPNYQPVIVAIEQAQLTSIERAQTSAIRRLVLALRDTARKAPTAASPVELGVLLRQVIRSHSSRLMIRPQLWEVIAGIADRCGLVASDEGGIIEVRADDWCPNWLPKSETIDHLVERRSDDPAVGDGVLWTTGLKVYQSEAQKLACGASLFAGPGTTVLVTLPTGAGKSLCAQLPSWVASRGGQQDGGTTLVVVPTIALAQDQERQGGRLFREAHSEKYKPHSLTSATPPEMRQRIYEMIELGTIPMLYVSPEALVDGTLGERCLTACRRGTLGRLVIDEAHLVETWGASFRSAFQFMASYRRQLLKASGGQLRTLLLSATISESCGKLLEALFSEPGKFSHVAANRLRPEIGYWMCPPVPTKRERIRRVLEALHYLPRPAMLYVTERYEANRWKRILEERGFCRFAVYTGGTASDARLRIGQAWVRDDIDLMVATSAFGLGVDKGDVRTVIHACLPETIDRFYQEVGRAGRDGCSAVSLLCPTVDDYRTAHGLAGKLITIEKAQSRIAGMMATRQYEPGSGRRLSVDMDAPPTHNPEAAASDLNRYWNEHTLLMLSRAGIVRIEDARPDATDGSDSTFSRMHIELLHPELLDDDKLGLALEEHREEELQLLQMRFRQLAHLLKSQTELSHDGYAECIAYILMDLYPGTTPACGGCPACRAAGREVYSMPLSPEAALDGLCPASPVPLDPVLARRIGGYGQVTLYWDEGSQTQIDDRAPALIRRLIELGVAQIIAPDELCSDLASALGFHGIPSHLLLPHSWLEKGLPLARLPTTAIYPTESRRAEQFHNLLAQLLPAGSPLVNVVFRTLELRSLNGRFLDRIDGLADPVTLWLSHTTPQADEELLF